MSAKDHDSVRFLNLGEGKFTQGQWCEALQAVKEKQKAVWNLIANLGLVDQRLGSFIQAVQTYMQMILQSANLNDALRYHRTGLSFDRKSDITLFEV